MKDSWLRSLLFVILLYYPIGMMISLRNNVNTIDEQEAPRTYQARPALLMHLPGCRELQSCPTCPDSWWKWCGGARHGDEYW